MREFDWVLPRLRDSLQLLAAPADEQIRYLRSRRFHQDELALDYHDSYVLVPQLEVEHYLTREQAQAAAAVDEQLDAMSGPENAGLWTDDAIRQAPEWNRVRQLALAALALLEGASAED